MKANFNVILVMVALTLVGAMIISTPNWLSDSNCFLKSFVAEPLLSALGVILAINLASLAQLHLSLNEIEERQGQQFLAAARSEVRSSARWMIGLFVVAIVIVVAKPLVGINPRVIAFANGSAMLILGFYILVMADIVDAIFDLKPNLATPGPPSNGDS